MSTSAPAPGGQEEAFAYFLTTDIPEIVEGLIRIGRAAGQAGLRSLSDAAGAVLDEMLADVNRVAVEMAGVSEGLIIKKMIDTQSGNRPHSMGMETHIRSEPGPLGFVRVALLAELDKIVNPRGYGPYWRAQEYGTGQEGVPSQVGRPLFGTFEPSGEPPDEAQRGLGEGRDLAFVPMGSAPGFGRISVELPGRHFLRDGSIEAGERYVQAMAAIQAKYLERLQALKQEIVSEQRLRYVLTIEA